MNSYEMTQKMMKKMTGNKGMMKKMMRKFENGNMDIKDFTDLK